MTKTVYYNYLIAEDESVIKTLSDLGFSGKYEFLDGKLYVYIENDILAVFRIGLITEEDLLRALENKAVFTKKKNVEFENSFKSFSPEETFSAQMTYDAKIKKYFWWK